MLYQLHSTHGIQEAPQFYTSESNNYMVEVYLSIVLALPSHNWKCVLTALEYASPVWGGIPKYLVKDLQNRSLSIERLSMTFTANGKRQTAGSCMS